MWTFYEVPHIPKISSQNHSPLLYPTSRWVLSFRNEPQIISIDCFDPYGFQWLGTILNFNTTFYTSYNIQAVVPVVSSATTASDSLLIIVAGTQSGTNNHAETATEFWKLDISTSVPSNFTLTKLNPIIHQSDVVVFMTDLDEEGHSESVRVTPLDDEMTLFYGGAKQLQFLNTSSLTFSPQPQWLTSANNSTEEIKKDNAQPTSNRQLAIILGSVLGGLFFIFFVLLLFWCCRRRKNQNKILLRPNNNNNNIKERKLPSPSNRKNVLLLDKKPKRAEEETERPFQESPSISQFTLSPIVPLSPINLFPLPSDDLASVHSGTTGAIPEVIDIQHQQPCLIKSRFQELFDYSMSSATNAQHIAASQSLPLESASAILTTTNNEEPLNIPRSVSSYV